MGSRGCKCAQRVHGTIHARRGRPPRRRCAIVCLLFGRVREPRAALEPMRLNRTMSRCACALRCR
eukprot:4298349-Prymnesium_polylepis.1